MIWRMLLKEKTMKVENLQYKYYRISHALRLTISFIFALLLLAKLDLVKDVSWILITMVVIVGPMSYKGSVYPRAIQRSTGTLIGIIFGILSFYAGKYSFSGMIVIIALGIFTCGYLTLSKMPYAGILIGITLSVTVSVSGGNLDIALWRISDVFIGCVIAVIFSSIFPHKACIHWNIELYKLISNLHQLYCANLSRNLFNRPELKNLNSINKKTIANILKLSAPAQKETRIDKKTYELLQETILDIISYLNLIEKAFWDCPVSHHIICASSLSKKINYAIDYRFKLLQAFIRDDITDPDAIKKFHHKEFEQDVMEELRSTLLGQHAGNDIAIENKIYGYFYLGTQIIDKLDALAMLLSTMKTQQRRHIHLRVRNRTE